MGDLTIRNIDESTLDQISYLAGLHKRSIEHEALTLIRYALGTHRELTVEIFNRIAAMTPKGVPQPDSVDLLREDRER